MIKQRIRIFLASSKELLEDRVVFGDLMRRLDNMYEKQGIRIYLFKWEDYDAGYNKKRKQDEYNEEIKNCDVFVALFQNTAGEYTLEEFNEARRWLNDQDAPKIFVYCKDPEQGKQDEKLEKFKEELSNELGHYWETYNNTDTLGFKFTYQLQLIITGMTADLDINQGIVSKDGCFIADFRNLAFVANNKEYNNDVKKLENIDKKIVQLEEELKAKQEDETSNKELQMLKREKSELEGRIEKQQKYLLETAMILLRIRLEKMDEMIQKANEALEQGDLDLAEKLLTEIQAKTMNNSDKKQFELYREIDHRSVKAAMLHAKVIMERTSLPIDDRWEKAREKYEIADKWASKSGFDSKSYAVFLRNYAELLKGRKNEEAIKVYEHQIGVLIQAYGLGNKYVARVYNDIAELLIEAEGVNNLNKADLCLQQASIIQQTLNDENLEMAKTYQQQGTLQRHWGHFEQAKECLMKAKEIRERLLIHNHKDIAEIYNELGLFYKQFGEKEQKAGNSQYKAFFDQAEEYYKQALEIRRVVLGEAHEKTLWTRNNLANLYRVMGNCDEAIKTHEETIRIKENTLGTYHLSTLKTYNNLAKVYYDLGDRQSCEKALEIHRKVLEKKKNMSESNDNWFSISKTYYNMGLCYAKLGQKKEALDCYEEAKNIRIRQKGNNDKSVEEVLNAIDAL